MESIKPLLAIIQKKYDNKMKTIKRLRKEQSILKQASIDYGTPTYKNKKYLRIVRPAAKGQPRQFEYIGADPEKQKSALDALVRGQHHDTLNEEIEGVEKTLFTIQSTLDQVANELD